MQQAKTPASRVATRTGNQYPALSAIWEAGTSNGDVKTPVGTVPNFFWYRRSPKRQMAEFITEVLGKRKNKISASLDDSASSPDNKKSRKSVSSDAEIAKEDPIFFFWIIFFIFSYKVLTYNTYLQTTYGTYATNKTIPYLQKQYLFTM